MLLLLEGLWGTARWQLDDGACVLGDCVSYNLSVCTIDSKGSSFVLSGQVRGEGADRGYKSPQDEKEALHECIIMNASEVLAYAASCFKV